MAASKLTTPFKFRHYGVFVPQPEAEPAPQHGLTKEFHHENRNNILVHDELLDLVNEPA